MVALGWFLDFNFLSATSWSEKYQAFIDYRWKIKTGFDFVLLFFMLFWIPLWLIGWRLVYLVKWEKFKPSPRRRTIVKKTFELFPQSETPAKNGRSFSIRNIPLFVMGGDDLVAGVFPEDLGTLAGDLVALQDLVKRYAAFPPHPAAGGVVERHGLEIVHRPGEFGFGGLSGFKFLP